MMVSHGFAFVWTKKNRQMNLLVRVPVESRIFSFSPAVKRPGRGVDHSLSTSVEAEKTLVYISTSDTSSWRSAELVKQRDYSAFTFMLKPGHHRYQLENTHDLSLYDYLEHVFFIAYN
jgi:hypothetical protein